MLTPKYIELQADEKIAIQKELSKALGVKSIEEYFIKNDESIFAQFINAFKNLDGRVTPISIKELSKKLFNDNERHCEVFLS